MRALFASYLADCEVLERVTDGALDFQLERRLMGLVDTNPVQGKSSLLVDLERGLSIQSDGLAGTVHRLGVNWGISTPVRSNIFASLRSFRKGDAISPIKDENGVSMENYTQ